MHKVFIAAELLRQEGASQEITDILYLAAETENFPADGQLPSPALYAKLISRSTVGNVDILSQRCRDAALLDKVARRDKRKTVRRTIAMNRSAKASTLTYLLAWGLSNDGETAKAAFGNESLPVADALRVLEEEAMEGPLSLSASSYGGDNLSFDAIVRRVPADREDPLWQQAHRIRSGELRTRLSRAVAVAARTDEELLLRTVEKLGADEARTFMKDVVEVWPGDRPVTYAVAELLTRLWRGYAREFPWDFAVNGNGAAQYKGRTYTPEAIQVLTDRMNEPGGMAAVLLATAKAVDEDTRLRLLALDQRLITTALAGMSDLTPAVQDDIIRRAAAWPLNDDLPVPGQWQTSYPARSSSGIIVHPLLAFVRHTLSGANITEASAEKVLDWCLTSGASFQGGELWARLADHLSQESIVRLLRAYGNSSLTSAWMLDEKGGASHESILALLDEPGRAFYHSAGGRSVTPDSRARIWDALRSLHSDPVRVFVTHPTARIVVDSMPRPLQTFGRVGVAYLWARLGEQRNDPRVVNMVLELGPSWEGTMDELVVAATAVFD